jgi:nitrogen fixation/metabolism regulation signal transduction histidine kinase
MTKNVKRTLSGRGKGYLLNVAGPQARFIIFLIFLLVAYTLLLRVFQKLAQIVQLPVFLPLSLISLLVFIGIVGTFYSHKFVGPMLRIRKAIENLADGDPSICLRLRESDDPMLQDLVKAISRLCEHSRITHTLIEETARELFEEIQALQEKIREGADSAGIHEQLEDVRKKQELLDTAIKSCWKI